MIATLPSRYFRKARINIDSLIEFSGTKQIFLPHKPELATDNYTICFYVMVNSGGSFSLSKDAFTITYADFSSYVPEGTIAHIALTSTKLYVNGVERAMHSKVFNSTSDITISGNARWNNMPVWNRDLTELEIRSIHQLGGIISESTHENCIAHYIAMPGSTKFWDVVGQYNYAKVTPIEPYHGQYINFSNEELGVEKFGIDLSHIDLYNKRDFRRQVALCDSQRLSISNDWSGFHTSEPWYFSVYLYCLPSNFNPNGSWATPKPLISERNGFISPVLPYISFYALQSTSSWRFEIRSNGQGSVQVDINLGSRDIFQNKWVKIEVVYDGSKDESGLKFYRDRNEIAHSVVVNNLTGDFESKGNYCLLYGFISAGGRTTSGYIKDLIIKRNNITIVDSPLGNEYQIAQKNFSGDNLTYSHTTSEIENINTWIERDSLLPVLQNALKLNGVDQDVIFPASYTPNTNVGYIAASFIAQSYPCDIFNVSIGGILRGMSLFVNGSGKVETRLEFSAVQNRSIHSFPDNPDSTVQLNTINSIIWACNGTKWFAYLNGILLNQETPIATARYFFQDLRLAQGFNLLNVTIGSLENISYRKLSILDFHIGSYLPSKRQIISWHNNSLLFQGKSNLHLKYNFNQIKDDTGVSGDYLIIDQSGNVRDGVLNNYTANQATPTNKEYQVIPINALRDNEIHHEFAGDTVNPMSEQINLLDGITAPTDNFIFEGALPTGLSLSASGALTGTATQTGTFDLLVRLVDAAGVFEYKRVRIIIS